LISLRLTLDGDDELRDNGEDLGVAVGQEVEDTLDGKESVWVLLLTDAFHEDGQVMMVVQLVHFDFPGNFVGRTVLDGNGEISSVVKAAELRRGNGSASGCTGSGLLNDGLFFRFVLGEALSASTLASPSESCYKKESEHVHHLVEQSKGFRFQISKQEQASATLSVCQSVSRLLCFKGCKHDLSHSNKSQIPCVLYARKSNVFCANGWGVNGQGQPL